jgi:membrane-associated PAP2 superfamily phosphatase
MYSNLILRVGSKYLSAALGGFSLFCLFYAGRVTNPDLAWQLFGNALILGGLATAIAYCQEKWLK